MERDEAAGTFLCYIDPYHFSTNPPPHHPPTTTTHTYTLMIFISSLQAGIGLRLGRHILEETSKGRVCLISSHVYE